MNKFIFIAIIVSFVQVMTWFITWGCLSSDVIVGDSWLGISKETITNNTVTVFWICFGISLSSTLLLVRSAIHLWFKDLYKVVEKLQQENNK